MATGILGTADLTAATNTTVYTVPASTQASMSVNICNRGTTNAVINLAVAASATPTNDEYFIFRASIPPGGSLERSGLVAQAAKLVVVYSDVASVSVQVYGYEDTV